MLLLSATLTATDTVSILSLIKRKKFPKIHSIILGEGLLNDAVAIILFKISLRSSDPVMNNVVGMQAAGFLWEFLSVTLMSVFFGCATGYAFIQLVS